ncbi:MAG TPA: hypothetical protein VMT76_11550 [Puia sp.]|nr:hypothetical protein [Puia sp.]
MKIGIFQSIALTLVMIAGTAISYSSKAQTKTLTPKIYAVINRADWCPVCKANGGKIMSEVMPACKNLKVQFVANDLTNDKSISASVAELKKNNLYNTVKETKATGIILLVDAKTKKLVKQISVAEPSADIIKEITAAQS